MGLGKLPLFLLKKEQLVGNSCLKPSINLMAPLKERRPYWLFRDVGRPMALIL